MTADERFKELGYDKISDNYWSITYSKPIGYTPKGYFEEVDSIDIDFYKHNRTFRKRERSKSTSYKLGCTKEELAAIKLKKKELGWE